MASNIRDPSKVELYSELADSLFHYVRGDKGTIRALFRRIEENLRTAYRAAYALGLSNEDVETDLQGRLESYCRVRGKMRPKFAVQMAADLVTVLGARSGYMLSEAPDLEEPQIVQVTEGERLGTDIVVTGVRSQDTPVQADKGGNGKPVVDGEVSVATANGNPCPGLPVSSPGAAIEPKENALELPVTVTGDSNPGYGVQEPVVGCPEKCNPIQAQGPRRSGEEVLESSVYTVTSFVNRYFQGLGTCGEEEALERLFHNRGCHSHMVKGAPTLENGRERFTIVERKARELIVVLSERYRVTEDVTAA